MTYATITDNELTIAAGDYRASISVRGIVHCWSTLSHHPERRAAMELSDLATTINQFGEHAAQLVASGGAIDMAAEMERYATKAVSLWRAAWSADSRCASSFIVGGSNFPVRRMEKRNRSADNRRAEIRDHDAAARKAIKRTAWPHGAPGGAIRGSNPEAVDLMRDKLNKAREHQELMKTVNKVIRTNWKAGGDAVVAALLDLGLGKAVATALATPDCCGGTGFHPYQLANNSANIKRMESRLAGLEAKRNAAPADDVDVATVAGDVTVSENIEADRIQLFFPGKPDGATRSKLKARGFRWSPTQGAWQRHLNNAGRSAAQQVLAELSAAKYGE
jgi:hypothetical protein